MTRATSDGCGCFPTGRHYPGIAHLLKVAIRGVVEWISAEEPWHDIPIAVLDVETTGRNPETDRVIEIGIVVGQRGSVVRKHSWLVNPGIPIAEDARAVHGISDDDVKDAPRFEAIAHEVIDALAGCVPAAYNASFDKAFMWMEFTRAGTPLDGHPHMKRIIEWLDPLVWARAVFADEKSRTLGDMAARLGVSLENAHRATDDAEAALMVLYKMAEDARIPRAYGAFVQEQRRYALQQADARRLWRNS
ncbi:MAG: 3'-5' exonuclease [Polyangiaceae bacterium]